MNVIQVYQKKQFILLAFILLAPLKSAQMQGASEIMTGAYMEIREDFEARRRRSLAALNVLSGPGWHRKGDFDGNAADG